MTSLNVERGARRGVGATATISTIVEWAPIVARRMRPRDFASTAASLLAFATEANPEFPDLPRTVRVASAICFALLSDSGAAGAFFKSSASILVRRRRPVTVRLTLWTTLVFPSAIGGFANASFFVAHDGVPSLVSCAAPTR